MRRLEALSNTIFGVAMTLLAYNFPKEPFLNGVPPTWSAIFVAYQSQVIALVLSFVVSGMYWIAHQRRLAYEPHARRSIVYLNLLFLLSIVALPITAGLYGTYGSARDIVVLYSCHLALIGVLNALLWFLAGASRGEPYRAVGSFCASAIFFVATIVALVVPQFYIAEFIWPFAFATPFIDEIMFRRRARSGDQTPSLPT
jgi:uncharacterized membrane protein